MDFCRLAMNVPPPLPPLKKTTVKHKLYAHVSVVNGVDVFVLHSFPASTHSLFPSSHLDFPLWSSCLSFFVAQLGVRKSFGRPGGFSLSLSCLLFPFCLHKARTAPQVLHPTKAKRLSAASVRVRYRGSSSLVAHACGHLFLSVNRGFFFPSSSTCVSLLHILSRSLVVVPFTSAASGQQRSLRRGRRVLPDFSALQDSFNRIRGETLF